MPIRTKTQTMHPDQQSATNVISVIHRIVYNTLLLVMNTIKSEDDKKQWLKFTKYLQDIWLKHIVHNPGFKEIERFFESTREGASGQEILQAKERLAAQLEQSLLIDMVSNKYVTPPGEAGGGWSVTDQAVAATKASKEEFKNYLTDFREHC